MSDGANEPAAARVPAMRTALLLGVGGGVGLALGVVLTTGVFATYSFFKPTLPFDRDALQVFNELNELRQQVNQLNEDRQVKDQATTEAVRQALGAVASMARAPK